MDLLALKVVAIVAIFLTGVAGGLLPHQIEKSRHGQLYLSLGSALAGGVFLGAGLIHMLPDA